MLKRSKQILSIFIVSLLLAVMVACGGTQETTTQGTTKETEKTVEHLKGTTVIKGEPKNVAVLQPFYIDYLLSVGIVPKAAVSAGPHTQTEYTWYFKDQLKKTTNLGWQINPNLETILSTKPDLIISGKVHEQAYDNFTKMAPTVLIPEEETKEGVKDWRKAFLKTASIFDKEKEAEKVIAEYDKKAAESKTKLGKTIKKESVMFLRITGKELRYYGAKNFDVLYGDLGLQPPAHFPASNTEKTFEPISIEKLPEINPDHIFLLVEADETYANTQKSEIWKNLNAVKNKQVHQVDYDLWLQGAGPIANKLIIDQAVDFLTK